MAWHFNETPSQYVTVGDDAAMTLPDGDWSLGGWVKFDDNAGSVGQYFLSHDTIHTANSINLYSYEASYSDASVRNKLTAAILDAGGDYYSNKSGYHCVTSSTPASSTAWQHVLLVRSGSTLTWYINGAAAGSATNATVNSIDPSGSLHFGTRQDLNTDRCYGGALAAWGKWDRALSSDERSGLAAKKSPLWYPADLVWHLSMEDYTEAMVPLTVTNHGSTLVAGPGILPPVCRQVFGSRTFGSPLFGAV